MTWNRAVTPGQTRLVLVSLLLIVAGGCGGEEETAGPTTTSSSTTTTAPTTTTTTMAPTTTTTLGPEGVLDTFVAYITDPELAGLADLEIEATVGDISISGTGSIEFAGSDSFSVIEMSGFPAEESITVGGVEYQRVGDGPWVTEDPVPDPFAEPDEVDSSPVEDLEFLAALKTMGELEHQGVEERDGVTLHRIDLPAGTVADPLAFGIGEDEQVVIDFVFWATPDGVPYQLQFVFDDTSDPELPTTFSIDFNVVEVGVALEISIPDAPWRPHQSADLGYRIAHPRGWEVEELRDEIAADFFIGVGGEEMHLFLTELDPPEQVSLNVVLDTFRSVLTNDLGYEFAEAEEIEALGVPARRVAYTGEDELYGPFSAVYVVVQPELETLAEFTLLGDAGDEPALTELLDAFLSTFELE